MKKTMMTTNGTEDSFEAIHPSFECDGGPECTYSMHNELYRSIYTLKIKDKRDIFKVMRVSDDVTHNSFLTTYGITAGQFAIYHILTDNGRRNDSSMG